MNEHPLQHESRSTVVLLIENLRLLSSGRRIQYTNHGACSNLYTLMCGVSSTLEVYRMIAFLGKKYSEYSGLHAYPIKGGYERYRKFQKWKGKYGEDRKAFCAWFADHLEAYYLDNMHITECDWDDWRDE